MILGTRLSYVSETRVADCAAKIKKGEEEEADVWTGGEGERERESSVVCE